MEQLGDSTRAGPNKGNVASGNSSSPGSNESSLCLSPPLLPEGDTDAGKTAKSESSEHTSGASSITERISTNSDSVENDRSFPEIEIANVPVLDDQELNISQECRPSLITSDSLASSAELSAPKHATSILDEILRNEQFRSEKSDSYNDTSLDIFSGVNLDDSSALKPNRAVVSVDERDLYAGSFECRTEEGDVAAELKDAVVRSLEDRISAKDQQIAALMYEVDSLKEMASNHSTLSANTTITEYKHIQEISNKLADVEKLIEQRDEVIEELTAALKASTDREVELQTDCAKLTEEMREVQTQLKEVSETVRTGDFAVAVAASVPDLEQICSKLEAVLGPVHAELLRVFKASVSDYVVMRIGDGQREQQDEVKILRDRLEHEKTEHNAEIERLKELLANIKIGSSELIQLEKELNDKHAQELEELRTYYQEKCADIGKQYSDEVFSQQSRKLSSCNTGSEPDLASDIIYASAPPLTGPCGDTVAQTDLAKDDILLLKKQIDNFTNVLNKYDLNVLTEQECDTLRSELFAVDAKGSIKLDLACLRSEMQHKLDTMRQDYENRMHNLNDKFNEMENGYLEKIEAMQVQIDDYGKRLICTTTPEVSSGDEFIDIIKSYEVRLQQQIRNAQRDIINDLDAQIQTLSENPLDDSVWPENLLTIKKKFTDSYETEIAVLKQNHEQEVARIKEDNQKHLNSALERARRRSLRNSESFADAEVVKERNSLKKSSETLKTAVNDLLQYFGQCEEEVNKTLVDELVKQCGASDTEDTAIEPPGSTGNSQEAGGARRVHLVPNFDEVMQMLGKCPEEELDASVQFRDELSACLERLKEEAHAILALSVQLPKVVVGGHEAIAAMAPEQYFESKYYDRTSSPCAISELQEKARLLASTSTTKPNDLLQLLEEFCRETEGLTEQSKKERLDLIQQIDAADKKYRATNQFLEEQAVEREQERDDAQREIAGLRQQLLDKGRELAGFATIAQEVEQLEQQLRENGAIIERNERRFAEADAERQEAVDKIAVLRDIIKSYEAQAQRETDSDEVIERLKEVVKEHRLANEELLARLDAVEHDPHVKERCAELEDEVRRLRLANEFAGSEGTIKQIQLQLHELELNIDEGTRSLEVVHAPSSHTACSSPTEEMSVRDQIRPPTPNAAAEDCEIPLQQLARLKEKLVKHSRAEHAAIKKISDLEMQLIASKYEHDEVQNERDLLKDQVSEQVVLITSLQMRLDDQRIRAEQIQKQTNASLELKIYDLENDVQSLHDQLQTRDSAVRQLKKTIEELSCRLQDREQELCSSLEDKTNADLLGEIEKLRDENEMLRAKMESDAQNAQVLPSLVDNIISDKNRDIETLRTKLEHSEKQLDLYMSMNVDKEHMSREKGMLTYVELSTPDVLRRATRTRSLELSECPLKQHFQPEVSSIEKIESNPRMNWPETPLNNRNSTELQKTSEKRVHFSEEPIETILEDDSRIIVLTESLKSEQDSLRDARVELAETKMHLSEQAKEIQMLKEDSVRKDDMFYKLTKEKLELEKECRKIEGLEEELEKLGGLRSTYENLQVKYNEAVDALEERKLEISAKNKDNLKLQKEVRNKSEQLELFNAEISQLKEQYENSIEELRREFDEKDKQCSEATELGNEATADLAKVKELLYDRECELEILREDNNRFQDDIAKLESEIEAANSVTLKEMKHRKEIAERDLEITKLKSVMTDLRNEIIHLQDHLTEKDRIIDQMRADSETLRIHLETIKQKMNEQGNVYDLRSKLQQEKELNATLRAELTQPPAATSIDEMSEELKKQLDNSAHLDEALINALSSDDNDMAVVANPNPTKEEVEDLIMRFQSRLENSAAAIKELEMTLELERKQFRTHQAENGNLLKQLRFSLEKALENENQFAEMLNDERRKRMLLEAELVAFRQKNFSSSSSKTEYKSLPDTERLRTMAELQALQEINARLKHDLKTARVKNQEADGAISYSKDMYDSKCEEVRGLQAQIEKFREESTQAFTALKKELDLKIKEVENSRTLMAELEEEKFEYRKELTGLKVLKDECDALVREKKHTELLLNELNTENSAVRKELSRLRQELIAAQSSNEIPDTLMEQMNNIKTQMDKLTADNLLLSEVINNLKRERRDLRTKINEFEQMKTADLPFDSPTARANYLFGKYVRAESHRNALIWQKRYLLSLLRSYDFTNRFEPFPNGQVAEVRQSGVRRFRTAAFVIISITRMQFIVRRWRSGSRGGAYLSSHRKAQRQQQQQQPNFHVGYPVSALNFINPPPSQLHHSRDEAGRPTTPPNIGVVNNDWSGTTPPIKESVRSKRKERGYNEFLSSRPTTTTAVHLMPADSSASNILTSQSRAVSGFVERFNTITETLKLTAADGASGT